MLIQVFNTPKNHPKSKPFIDHVISFNYVNGSIVFRVYQIVNQHETLFTEKDDVEKLVLIEIGPRMTLQPIKMFGESLGGEALWQNARYITPNKARGKAMAQFVKKREKKETAKKEKKQLRREGKDRDAYLNSAFAFD
jgi:ribosome biogenesis protein BRX1